jgi:hypothetical protein
MLYSTVGGFPSNPILTGSALNKFTQQYNILEVIFAIKPPGLGLSDQRQQNSRNLRVKTGTESGPFWPDPDSESRSGPLWP